MRRHLVHVLMGLLAGVGCGLLTPYPGGGNPASLLADSRGPGGGSPIECVVDGMCEPADEPLVDPATDDSIALDSNEETLIAFPGEAFTIDLSFIAQNSNVVGGGIKFPGSDEIQWTFIDGLEGLGSGDIRFGYVVENDICDKVPPLCHEIPTEQFAVARNVVGDVDGDGENDGEFVVSPPVTVPVVLKCASCESPSCREIDALAGECQACSQPQECQEVFNLCFAEGRPKAGSEEAANFQLFFGGDGLAWKSGTVCVKPEDGGPSPADELCANVLEDLATECLEGDTDTDTDTDGMMMTGTG